MMKTILKFNTQSTLRLPTEFQADDVRFPDSFAEYFIDYFTQPGNIVFDPFAGFGTTMIAAEKLGRRAFGVEFMAERAEYIRSHLSCKDSVICGDSRRLGEIDLPMFDFVLTSPPYMQKTDHPEYPFAGYKITGQGYEDYLNDIKCIFKQLRKKLKSGAYTVIEVSNLLIDGNFTPLAWDIAQKVAAVLPLKQEIIIDWQCDTAPAYGFGYDHSYALVYQNA